MNQYNFMNTIFKYQLTEGILEINKPVVNQACPLEIKEILALLFGDNLLLSSKGNVNYFQKEDIKTQEYQITVADNDLTIIYGDILGAVYGSITLKHMIIECKGRIPKGNYIDKPSFLTRGLLYDISRNKVPKLETLYRLVDIMWELKYNQLQLYIEGLSYEYSHYKEQLQEESYITKKEMKALNQYCKDRKIDLVPNQNTLGHMALWLELEPLKELRKNPEGEFAFGKRQPCATLDTENPKSKEFIQNITEDLLESFDSNYYNVNLDEVFGLDENAYADWTSYMKELVCSKGKRMMMWSDMINTYPNLAEVLPKDVILMDWGYEDYYPFHAECKLLKEKGFEFYVCPGTSSWCSVVGRTNNMIVNIDNAITCGLKYGASGVINTDWGDQGHRQTFPISFPGIVAVGIGSWSGSALVVDQIAQYLDTYIYLDSTNKMGNLVLNLGNSYLLDEAILINGSFLHHQYEMGLCSKIEREDYIQKLLNWMIPYAKRFEECGDHEISTRLQNKRAYRTHEQRDYIAKISQEIMKVELNCEDAIAIKQEYELAVFMLNFSLDMTEFIQLEDQISQVKDRKEKLVKIQSDITILIAKYEKVWHDRNKKSQIVKSMECFENIETSVFNQSKDV